MTVSIIPSGAGSVAVRARPALPNTISTSGTVRISRFCTCIMRPTSAIDAPGNSVGMYIVEPSQSGGMNSVPSS